MYRLCEWSNCVNVQWMEWTVSLRWTASRNYRSLERLLLQLDLELFCHPATRYALTQFNFSLTSVKGRRLCCYSVSVCLAVSLSVSLLDYWKSYERILKKFFGVVGRDWARQITIEAVSFDMEILSLLDNSRQTDAVICVCNCYSVCKLIVQNWKPGLGAFYTVRAHLISGEINKIVFEQTRSLSNAS